MIIINKKQILNFLLYKWQLMIDFAAIERVYLAAQNYAIENNQPIPLKPPTVQIQPCDQIHIIKEQIMSILPETKFIDYTYESPAPLKIEDFVEMYIEDHHQCVEKVKELMEKLKIK